MLRLQRVQRFQLNDNIFIHEKVRIEFAYYLPSESHFNRMLLADSKPRFEQCNCQTILENLFCKSMPKLIVNVIELLNNAAVVGSLIIRHKEKPILLATPSCFRLWRNPDKYHTQLTDQDPATSEPESKASPPELGQSKTDWISSIDLTEILASTS